MTSTRATYKIAEAARLVGISASTLRLWESQGILVPRRTESGQRFYSDSDIALLQRAVWMRIEKGLNPAAIRAALVGDGNPVEEALVRGAPKNGIGHKLRLLRHRAKKTLDQVAREIGITGAILSTFERTSHGVSFKTLHEITHYFGTTVSALSGDQTGEQRAFVAAGQWRQWPNTMPGVTVQMLAEGDDNQMDCHRFVLAAGASSDGSYRHEGEEFMHLICGRLEVVLDDAEIHDLQPGDSLYFESRRRHAWTNKHDAETILIWINTPPTF